MSRGHGRVQRIILESVNGNRYGCTVRQLAYLTYGIGHGAPTEAQIVSVHRVVRRLLAEERVVERVMFGTDRYILPAAPRAPRPKRRRTAYGTDVMERQALECRDCDLRWVSEEGAPHRLCWSCGNPGTPAARRSRGWRGAPTTGPAGRARTYEFDTDGVPPAGSLHEDETLVACRDLPAVRDSMRLDAER